MFSLCNDTTKWVLDAIKDKEVYRVLLTVSSH